MRRTQFSILSNVVKLGSVLAVTISWSLHKSVLGAVVHGLCSWFYVLFYMITGG